MQPAVICLRLIGRLGLFLNFVPTAAARDRRPPRRAPRDAPRPAAVDPWAVPEPIEGPGRVQPRELEPIQTPFEGQ